MGNQLAKAVTTRPAELLSDLPNVVYKDTLGGGRVLKTFVCVHDEGGLVVVKVYLKREGSPDLDVYKRELGRIRDNLSGLSCPHLWPFQTWFESDSKAFLLRQYVFSNLYERISTRPFLSLPEKKWMAFQLLFAVGQAHEKGVYHGDIKCENVLVTSWNWVYLSDFASAYKPTYLPADNPADFSFFFDAGSRRRCYLAPERFVDKVNAEGSVGAAELGTADSQEDGSPTIFSPLPSQSQGGLTGAMDIFSLGCVLAELYMEGKSLFDLSELHAYRRGEYDPSTVLSSKVKDENMRALILHMIQLDPSKRLTAKEYLSGKWLDSGGTTRKKELFPSYMSQTLHGFCASLLPLDPDGRLSTIRLAYGQLKGCIAGLRADLKDSQGSDPAAAHESEGSEVAYTQEQRESLKEGMTLLVSLFCSLLRNTKTPSSKCACIRLLCESGMYCDDERKMQQILPYLLSMVNQSSTIVRSMALSALATILKSVESLPESEEKVFSEYIFPSLALLCSDPEEMVRVHFASELPKLIEVACRLLRIPLQHTRAAQPAEDGDQAGERKGDRQTRMTHLAVLKKEVSKILIDLTTGGHSTSATMQATMQNFECFCDFFGVQETNNLLLPLFITFLNHSDWHVRRDFFKQLPIVCRYTVPRNKLGNVKVLESFLIPCVEQAFLDPEPEVLSSCLSCLCRLVESKSIGTNAYVLEKITLLGLVEKCKPFLGGVQHQEGQQHPRQVSLQNQISLQSIPIQVFVSSVKLVAACARRLSQVDIYAHLLPRLKDVNWSVECPNLRDEMCIFDCLGMQNVRLENRKLNMRQHPQQNASGNVQDSRLSPGIAIYSVAKSDFLSTPEQSMHTAVRTGALQNHSTLKKVLHSSAAEVQRQSMDDNVAQRGPSASISMLNESNFFGRNGNQQKVEKNARGSTQNAQSAVHQRNISDAVVDALSTGVSGHANPRSYTYTWQPQGILISHLAEHKRAVNKLSISEDNFFLTSASDDGTCKIWDCRKLEKDISFKSRLTYSKQGGRILSCASLLQSKQSVASASSDGSVHLWNVEYVTRQGLPDQYTGITRIGNACDAGTSAKGSEGAALGLSVCDENVICYATEHGSIHGYDHRQGKDAWTLSLAPSLGMLRSMFCEDLKQTWLATITNVGVVSLFDLRFSMCAKQWQHPHRRDIHAMVPYNDLMENDSNSENCRVLISAGEHETAVWNIFEGRCEQIFRNLSEGANSYAGNPSSCSPSLSVSSKSLSDLDAESEAVNSHLRSRELGTMHALSSPQSPQTPTQGAPLLQARAGVGHRAILPLPNGGFLTAGSDQFMRFWDPQRFEFSYLMCGPYAKLSAGNSTGNPMDWIVKPPVYYAKKIFNGISTVEEAKHGAGKEAQSPSQQQKGNQKAAKGKATEGGSKTYHEDSILDLALLDSQERIVLSCSRDGIIKAWK